MTAEAAEAAMAFAGDGTFSVARDATLSFTTW